MMIIDEHRRFFVENILIEFFNPDFVIEPELYFPYHRLFIKGD
jgi:hypothetical protein